MISRLVPNGLGLEGECGWRARWTCSSQMTHELEEVANAAGHLSQEFKELWRYSLTRCWQTRRRTDGLPSDKPSRLGCDNKVQGKLWNLGASLFFSALPSLPAFPLARVIFFFPSHFWHAPILNQFSPCGPPFVEKWCSPLQTHSLCRGLLQAISDHCLWKIPQKPALSLCHLLM